MVQLAMQLRLQNMTKDDILKEAIQQKSQMSVIRETGEICFTGQVKADKQKVVFSEILLNVNTSKISEEPSIEDIETGYDLYHVVVFCPSKVFKLYTMIDQQLSAETTRTIIQTTVNLFRSKAITTDKSIFTLHNM